MPGVHCDNAATTYDNTQDWYSCSKCSILAICCTETEGVMGRRTTIRKSTGCKTSWHRQQKLELFGSAPTCVTLSSAEAELCSVVRQAGRLFRVQRSFKDLGVPGLRLEMALVCSSAKFIALRRWTGRVRHNEVQRLWLQSKMGLGDQIFKTIQGIYNSADSGTDIPTTSAEMRHCLHKLFFPILQASIR